MSPTGGLDDADSLALLERQTQILELIAAGTSLPDVLDGITAALEEFIQGCRCSVLLLDSSTSTLRHGAAPSLPRSYTEAIDGLVIAPDAGSCGAAAFLGIDVVAEDIGSDPRWERFRDMALSYGLRSSWSSPIRARGGVVGTFAVYRTHPHRPGWREQRLVETFTHLASLAIGHNALYQALRESEERFRRAFEDNATGMALATIEGRILKLNRTLRQVLQRPEPELVGERLQEVITPVIVAKSTAELLGRLLAGEVISMPFEVRATRADGAGVVMQLVISVVRDADGAAAQFCLNLVDVTERRVAERDRVALRDAEVARKAAEAASRAKSALVSTLSHEVRTPLQAITGFTELLGSLDLPVERRRAALWHIHAASDHILSLVDDVLDVARIEAGALPVDLDDVAVASVAAEVLDMLQPLAAERHVTLVQDGSPATVRADRRRLRQVLINLVTNGIRYNQAGGWVKVSAHQDGPRVAIVIGDSGRGILPEQLERLFVPFDRLDADAGPERGAGLGLVLARGLMEAMSGRLEVESVIDVGTSIHLSLPASKSSTAATQSEGPAGGRGPLPEGEA